jgi:23S rRNA (cytosine1962-C5)-methyltransferase
MWTRGREPVDVPLFVSRARAAFALRATVLNPSETDAYRVVHGEGDRMPGLIVDRYGPVAVLRVDGAGAAARVTDFAGALWPLLEAVGVTSVVLRSGGRGAAPTLDSLHGPRPAPNVCVRERGVPFIVDLEHGQKTGAFLDQRENRRRVAELARGRRVLNLFSHSAGFGLHAMFGGAASVTNVDVSAAAHATGQASFRAAGIDLAAVQFITADVASFLRQARDGRRRWDLIVSDPPSFAPNERAKRRAIAAYRQLHRACVDVLDLGGILCAASCSSHVDEREFLTTLDDGALGWRPFSVIELRGAGPDHPTLAAFPEGRYLKFAVLVSS